MHAGVVPVSLSASVLERCGHPVRIPTFFCVNVAMAGAIVMYDRATTLGRYAPRPLRLDGPAEPLAPHVHGGGPERVRSGALTAIETGRLLLRPFEDGAARCSPPSSRVAAPAAYRGRRFRRRVGPSIRARRGGRYSG